MSKRINVLIVGGGPAGSAAALTLRRWLPEVSVMLVRRAAPASDAGAASVGETLTPGVVPLLDFLGLRESFLQQGHLPAGGTASAWGSDLANHRHYLFTGAGQGWQIDRSRFDAWLRTRALESGAQTLRVHQTTLVGQGDGVVVKVDGEVLKADYLIDASGRTARLARALGAKLVKSDDLVAQARWFDLPEARPASSDGALIASVADGWWYTAELPQRRGVQTLMCDTATLRHEALDPDGFWQRSCHGAPAIAERVRDWRPTGERQIRPAGSQHLEPVWGPAWVAAGDAAMAFDPLTSMGIGFAISSGIEAARVAAAALDGDLKAGQAYAQTMLDVRHDYRQRLFSFYQMERRWDTAFWRDRQSSVMLSTNVGQASMA